MTIKLEVLKEQESRIASEIAQLEADKAERFAALKKNPAIGGLEVAGIDVQLTVKRGELQDAREALRKDAERRSGADYKKAQARADDLEKEIVEARHVVGDLIRKLDAKVERTIAAESELTSLIGRQDVKAKGQDVSFFLVAHRDLAKLTSILSTYRGMGSTDW